MENGEPVGRLELIQELVEEILEIQKSCSNSAEAMARVSEIVETSTRLVEKSEDVREKVLDAKVLHTGTQMVRPDIVDTNLTIFDTNEYCNGLLDFVSKDSLSKDYDWCRLAATSSVSFRRSIPVSYVVGCLQLETPPKLERKRAERASNSQVVDKKVLSVIENTDESVDNSKSIYAHILKCLVLAYKKNDKKPVNVYKFVVDPNSFWTTVENVFNLLFLVKDGNVTISVDSKGLPTVEPNLQKASKGSQPKVNFAIRMDKTEWKQLKNSFDITKASITPFSRS